MKRTQTLTFLLIALLPGLGICENISGEYLPKKITPEYAYVLCSKIFSIAEQKNILIVIDDIIYNSKYCEHINSLISNPDYEYTSMVLKDMTEKLSVVAKKIVSEKNKPRHSDCTKHQMELSAKRHFCYGKSPLGPEHFNQDPKYLCFNEHQTIICSDTDTRCISYQHFATNETFVSCGFIDLYCNPFSNEPIFRDKIKLKTYNIYPTKITPSLTFFDEDCNDMQNHPVYPYLSEPTDKVYQKYTFPK